MPEGTREQPILFLLRSTSVVTSRVLNLKHPVSVSVSTVKQCQCPVCPAGDPCFTGEIYFNGRKHFLLPLGGKKCTVKNKGTFHLSHRSRSNAHRTPAIIVNSVYLSFVSRDSDNIVVKRREQRAK